jgi:hypothetical protein
MNSFFVYIFDFNFYQMKLLNWRLELLSKHILQIFPHRYLNCTSNIQCSQTVLEKE